MKENVERALNELRKGNFVLVYDAEDRESETDFIIAAEKVKGGHIRQMRNDGGGLIILIVGYDVHSKLALPFMADLLAENSQSHPVFAKLVPNDIPYDTKSSFSITINHRKTFTGITDIDRAMTVSGFAEVAEKIRNMGPEEAQKLFGSNFRAPGHVPICSASKDLLKARFGHTELGTALVRMAGMTPVACGCEMMGSNGKALSKKEAQEYAKKNNLVFLEGSDVIDAWREQE